MLRNLVNEVVSRRMWPIPLVAIVVAAAAPLLFMKSAGDTPVSTAPPPMAQPGKLPTGAERLVSTDDKSAATRSKAKHKSQDPFAPPKSAEPKSDGPAPAAAATASAAATSSPGGVVIQNSDGSSSTMTVPATTKRAAAPKASSTKTSTAKRSTSRKTTPRRRAATTTVSNVPTSTYVDVRFGERKDTYLRYRVPRLQTFRAGGRIAAMFVRYSAARNVAVFAVAPSTKVKGDVKCRTIKGVCRYVDIPAGKYVRLVLRDMDGKLISRRLDVVSIRTLRGKEDAAPRENPLDTATCLLKGLLRLAPGVPSIASDACA